MLFLNLMDKLGPTTLVTLCGILLMSLKWLSDQIAKFTHLIRRVPGPRPLPVFGNALVFFNAGYDEMLEIVQETWIKTYGPIFRWFEGFQCHFCISSPELVETVLSSPQFIRKGVHYDFFHQWLGDGLAFSIGQKWKSRRRMLTPALHFKALETFVEVYNRHCNTLCNILDEQCGSSEDDNKTVDVFPIVNRYALDVICETVMGLPLNAQLYQDGGYGRHMQRILQILVERHTNPFLRSDFIFSFTRMGREYDFALKHLRNYTDDCIKRRRQELTSNLANPKEDIEKDLDATENIRRKSMLDILMQNGLTDLELREEINTFMFAGQDTATSLLSWFFYCMAANPNIQERVAEELQTIFGDSDRDCSMSDLQKMKYLDCCIKETLRIYPSLPMIERKAKEDMQIGEYFVPAGSNVCCLIYGMHRDPKTFPNPEVFDPERFFPDQSAGRHPYAYIPFSAGLRNCIGQKFAFMESRVVIATLLRRFRFTLSRTCPRPIASFQVITKPLNGAHLTITRRQIL